MLMLRDFSEGWLVYAFERDARCWTAAADPEISLSHLPVCESARPHLPTASTAPNRTARAPPRSSTLWTWWTAATKGKMFIIKVGNKTNKTECFESEIMVELLPDDLTEEFLRITFLGTEDELQKRWPDWTPTSCCAVPENNSSWKT